MGVPGLTAGFPAGGLLHHRLGSLGRVGGGGHRGIGGVAPEQVFEVAQPRLQVGDALLQGSADLIALDTTWTTCGTHGDTVVGVP